MWVCALLGCAPVGGTTTAGLDTAQLSRTQWVDVAAAQDRKPVSLVFKDASTVSGHAGCNGYFGQVSIQSESMTFSKVGLTRMMCEPESMDTESRYMKALDATRSARIDKGVLELIDGKGKVLWRFKPLT
jgi:heat shock protein HslJ